MYRSRAEREKMYEKEGGKDNKKDSWFRKKRGKDGKQVVTSILRVPYTGGDLREKMNEILRATGTPEGTKTVAQEDSGIKLKDMLVRPDPFPMETCGRNDCQTVTGRNETGQCKNTCWQQHINYTVFCTACKEEYERGSGQKYEYIEESSRGCYTRYKQELSEYTPKIKGFMYKHAADKHEGSTQVEFKIKRENIDKDPMRRILRESIRIEREKKNKSKILMNSRDEHFGVQTVRGTFGNEWVGE